MTGPYAGAGETKLAHGARRALLAEQWHTTQALAERWHTTQALAERWRTGQGLREKM